MKSLLIGSRLHGFSVTSAICLMIMIQMIARYRHRRLNRHYPLCTMVADKQIDHIVKIVKVSSVSDLWCNTYIGKFHVPFLLFVVFDDHWTEDCQYDVVSKVI